MSIRMKASFWSYLIASLLVATFGSIYLIRSQFMPYHADAVGMKWEEVPLAFQILILALMKTLGGSMLATVLALVAMLLIPFRKGERWVKYVIPVVSLVYAIPALYVTLYVRASTPGEPPWIAVGVGIVLVIVGFVLSLTNK